jgi:hypothetical protein
VRRRKRKKCKQRIFFESRNYFRAKIFVMASELRNFLKLRLQQDKITFYGHEREKNHVKNLFLQVSTEGVSNSALLIGAKKSGKTNVRRINK